MKLSQILQIEKTFFKLCRVTGLEQKESLRRYYVMDKLNNVLKLYNTKLNDILEQHGKPTGSVINGDTEYTVTPKCNELIGSLLEFEFAVELGKYTIEEVMAAGFIPAEIMLFKEFIELPETQDGSLSEIELQQFK